MICLTLVTVSLLLQAQAHTFAALHTITIETFWYCNWNTQNYVGDYQYHSAPASESLINSTSITSISQGHSLTFSHWLIDSITDLLSQQWCTWHFIPGCSMTMTWPYSDTDTVTGVWRDHLFIILIPYTLYSDTDWDWQSLTIY